MIAIRQGGKSEFAGDSLAVGDLLPLEFLEVFLCEICPLNARVQSAQRMGHSPRQKFCGCWSTPHHFRSVQLIAYNNQIARISNVKRSNNRVRYGFHHSSDSGDLVRLVKIRIAQFLKPLFLRGKVRSCSVIQVLCVLHAQAWCRGSGHREISADVCNVKAQVFDLFEQLWQLVRIAGHLRRHRDEKVGCTADQVPRARNVESPRVASILALAPQCPVGHPKSGYRSQERSGCASPSCFRRSRYWVKKRFSNFLPRNSNEHKNGHCPTQCDGSHNRLRTGKRGTAERQQEDRSKAFAEAGRGGHKDKDAYKGSLIFQIVLFWDDNRSSFAVNAAVSAGWCS